MAAVSTEIEALKKQIVVDTQTLKESTVSSENEAAEFRDEKKDLVTQLTQLKNAIRCSSSARGQPCCSSKRQLCRLFIPLCGCYRHVRDVDGRPAIESKHCFVVNKKAAAPAPAMQAKKTMK